MSSRTITLLATKPSSRSGAWAMPALWRLLRNIVSLKPDRTQTMSCSSMHRFQGLVAWGLSPTERSRLGFVGDRTFYDYHYLLLDTHGIGGTKGRNLARELLHTAMVRDLVMYLYLGNFMTLQYPYKCLPARAISKLSEFLPQAIAWDRTATRRG